LVAEASGPVVAVDEVDDAGADHEGGVTLGGLGELGRLGPVGFGPGEGRVGQGGDDPTELWVVQRQSWSSPQSGGWAGEHGGVGSGEHEGAVGLPVEGPSVAVDDAVVGGAEAGKVGEVGGPAVVPVVEVVGVHPGGGGVAVREPASVVAYDHGVTQVG